MMELEKSMDFKTKTVGSVEKQGIYLFSCISHKLIIK